MPSVTPHTGSREFQKESHQANHRDIELMTRVSKGDIEAFQILVETHQLAVRGTVAKMLGNPSDAEDIAQQIFLRVWKAAPRYKPTAKFTTWLFTITRNLVFNETKRRLRKPTVSVEEREEENHQLLPDPHAMSPDKNALHSEFEKVIDKAIQSLPEKQRIAVTLRQHQEMPYAKIGTIISASEPSVKQLLNRARKQLRSSMRQYLDG